MSPAEETRKQLKVFGVAVTTFEDRSEELLQRIQSLESGQQVEVIAALRQVLALVNETNQSWKAVTDHLFETQRQAITEMMKALPRLEG